MVGGGGEEGKEEEKKGTPPLGRVGEVHRSSRERKVGWEGQEKRWEVVWGAPLQEGQSPSGELPILSRKSGWPDRTPNAVGLG